MASNLGELFVELGIFTDTEELKKFEEKLKKTSNAMGKAEKKNDSLTKSVAKFVKGAAGIVTAVAGAYVALNKLTDLLVKSNQEFLNLTRNSDIVLGTFQKWNNIGRMFGVRNAAQQLAGLNQRLFELKLTGQGAEGFMLAGINPLGQDAEGIMEQLRQRVAGLDDTAATFLLNKMGLDPSMLHLLRMTREEFEKFNAATSRYRLTEEQSKQIQAMNAQLEIARIKFQYLKDRAILAIMPYFVKFTQSLVRVTEFLMRITKRIGQFIVKWRLFVAGFAIALSKIKPVVNALKALGLALGNVITKLPIIGRFLRVLGAGFAKALLPLTAIYLILDDIATYFQGGESYFGDFMEWIKAAGDDFGKIFGKMFGGDFWGGFDRLAQKITEITDNIVMVLGSLLSVVTGLPLDKWLRKMQQTTQGPIIPTSVTRNLTKNNTTNNTTNNSPNITMNNTIHTTQTAQAVENDLYYINSYAYQFA